MIEPGELPQDIIDAHNEAIAETYFTDLGLDWESLKGKKILDLGSGLAEFAQAVKKSGIDVVSLDAHPELGRRR